MLFSANFMLQLTITALIGKKQMHGKCFLDTNILIYTMTNDELKREIAVDLLSKGMVISTQVINECINVMNRKLKYDYPIIQQVVNKLLESCGIVLVTIDIIRCALQVAEKYRYTYFDSLIIASALIGNYEVLYSEDLQHGQLIEKQVIILNPFNGHISRV